MKIRQPLFAVGDDKKKREGKISHNLVLYFSDIGSGPPWTDLYENWQGRRAHHVIILSNFGSNIFMGFRSTGGSKFPSSH